MQEYDIELDEMASEDLIDEITNESPRDEIESEIQEDLIWRLL